MVCEHRIEKIGNKKHLVIDCENCAKNSSLRNITCFRKILKKLDEAKNIDNITFNRNYKKILSEKSFKILKEYHQTLKKLPKEPELCDNCFEKNSILQFKLKEDPVGAIVYLEDAQPCENDKEYFDEIESELSKTKIYKMVKENKDDYNESELYHKIFRDRIVPGFISFHTDSIPPEAEILESYNINGAEITICKMPGAPYPNYYVIPKELNLSKEELSILRKAFNKISAEKFDIKKGLAICKKVIEDVASDQSKQQKKELARILARYTFGYGIVEVMLNDPKLQDIYIDSPGNKPIYVYHTDYEECTTNIVLTKEELEKLSTRFRMISGRPFDESFPVLHTELKDVGVRVAGITEPMTFEGTGFAFRKHSIHPWTLQMFIKNGMLTPKAAGLISFLVDAQQSILVTGPRGSGKTSLLGSLMLELPQNFRIITIEDTPEIPVEKLRDIGYNIQHIRVKSTLQREAYEITADEALRSALRLGESVLVIGEVRGQEAKSLFEAMRIGAAGNVVMGTIHGSSAYDVWDRIVNDLDVPSTSFKATDVVVSCAPIRLGEGLKRNRRVMAITEVLKYWKDDPHEEKGFLNLMEYDRKKDKLVMGKDFKKSNILKKIAKKKGMTMAQVTKSINTRAKIKEMLTEASKEDPKLGGVEFTKRAISEFYDILAGQKKIDYSKTQKKFKKWLDNEKKKV